MNAVIPIPHAALAASRISLRSSAGLGWQGFGAELFSVAAGVHRIPAQQASPGRHSCRRAGQGALPLQRAAPCAPAIARATPT